MLALGGQETARRAFLRIQISLEPGSVFGRGRNSRSTLVPSESKFGDPNGRSGTADRSVHTAVFGAGDLSAVALDRASIEIILWQHDVAARRICRNDANRSRDRRSTKSDLEKIIYKGFSPTDCRVSEVDPPANIPFEDLRMPEKYRQIDAMRIDITADHLPSCAAYFRTSFSPGQPGGARRLFMLWLTVSASLLKSNRNSPLG